MKEQKVIIEKKELAENAINTWLKGKSPYDYNVKSVKELRCGLLFIVLTK